MKILQSCAFLVSVFIGPLQANEQHQFFTNDRSSKALMHAYGGMSEDAFDQFILGRSFFTVPWVEAPAATTARDGLGPLFNANSCTSCHRNNGGGVSSTMQEGPVNRSIIFKLMQPQKNNQLKSGFNADPVYGTQLAINGNHDVPFEGRISVQIESIPFEYPDGQTVILKKPVFKISDLNYGTLAEETSIHPRRALSLAGLGLIERISDQQILQRQDEFDQNGDGISGKANRVWSVRDQQMKLGRFGWKATSPSVVEQSASALINDMGLTSPWFTEENCTSSQVACVAAYKSTEKDVPLQRLLAIGNYLTHLKMPRLKKNIDAKGKQLFFQSGCHLCHQTGYSVDQDVKLDPYSDFLLHDMGQALSDKSQIFNADPREWRTPPLWGIGLAKKLNPYAGFLHDGRATSLEQAILWHGGEASRAKQSFIDLPGKDRTKLLSFLNSL